MRTPRSATVLTLLGLMALAAPAEPWGFTGHRMINRKAITTLPPPLRALFEANAAYVAEHSVDPDLWRASGREEEAYSHFLDMDAFGEYPFAAIPRDEAAHLERNGREAATQGRLPWRVGEGYRGLVEAFKAKDSARVLERAAVLGHYVGDAHVPLHALVNYDGQLTGQKGVHDRWESQLVERFERQVEPRVQPGPARRVVDPVEFTFGVLRESYKAGIESLASDKACAGPRDLAATPEDDRYDNAYFSRFYDREGERLRSGLSSAASVIGSFWLSAWEEAGRPALPAFRFPYVRRQSRAVLLTLDGGSATLLDDAMARGVMPHLSQLRKDGAAARGALPPLPCKTAPGHAALYTGAWSDVNGISGNDVSPPAESVLRGQSGYPSTQLKAEPLWVTAARQGLGASVLATTQVFPFSPFLEERRFGGNYGRSLTLVDGYRNRGERDAVYRAPDLQPRSPEGWVGELPRREGEAREVGFNVNGAQVFGLLYGDPADASAGLDTLYLATRKDTKGGITLKPRPALGADPSAFAPLRLKTGGGEAGAYFRLYALAPDGSEALLYRTKLASLASNKPLVPPALDAGFVGNGAYGPYERGDLGPRLWEGGDGTAERRYLESVALVVREMTRLLEFSLERTAWDLIIGYLPYPDGALHLWLGRLDSSLPGHDPALAARLRPFLDQALALCDAYVGRARERAGSDTILAVTSDHGMVGAHAVVRPNVALARAGLLAFDAQGRVDLSRTRAIYFPGNSAYVLINRTSRPGGGVPPEQEEAVRQEVALALGALRDPASGRVVVTGILDPRDVHEPGIGGPNGGDLYLTLAPGYDLSAALTGEPVAAIPPWGMHFLEPGRPEMQAAFVMAGPGVAPGADLGAIRLIDVAPTLTRLLGLEPPAQATGAVLDKALARR